MKILIIGAGGNLGKIITSKLAHGHEIITAGRNSGAVQVDLSSPAAIRAMFSKTGKIDACVCVAGDSYSGELFSMQPQDLNLGIQNKLSGQVNLVLIGHEYMNDGGSFTLISGKMGDRPTKFSAGKALVNGGINSFVLAAALEMPRTIRINAVSPGKVSDIPIAALTAAYLRSIEGDINGEILRVNYN